MSESTVGLSSYSPLGDYDRHPYKMNLIFPEAPSPKIARLGPAPIFSPTEFSKLNINSWPASLASDESEEEFIFKFKRDYAEFHRETNINSVKVFDFDSNLISEDEKKRLRNTEAARRCREKIKKRTDDLEEELMTLVSNNDGKNQQRIRLLSQIGEQMRMLEMLKTRNPGLGPLIDQEARNIVEKYKDAVKRKRRTIEADFANESDHPYQKLQ